MHLGSKRRLAGDVLVLADEDAEGERLLQPVMQGGALVKPLPSGAESRAYAAENLAALPGQLRSLEHAADYEVTVSDRIRTLAAQI